MLDVQQLSCIRDKRILFDNLNFSVFAGDLIQIEGQNGAGKTTLLRIIAGLASADQGEVLWQGRSIYEDRAAFHQHLLFLGHNAGVKRELTAFENLLFYQKMHSVFDEEKLWYALARAGLAGREDIPAAQLSAGQNRRIALARLWVSDARLWILDEPLTAIDKHGVSVLEATFNAHIQKGGIILFTTHQDMSFDNVSLRRVTLGG